MRANTSVPRLFFQQKINDREYRIEVLAIATNRWRAEVVTEYGGPTALMPFYGASPDAARDGLTSWLSRIHRQPEASR
jgi:hypothetical protein